MLRPLSRLATIGSRRWIATLAAMTAVTALSIDMSLPAQPTIAAAFDVPGETASLTLSLFLVGFACAQLVTGYLSDKLGRRRVLLTGLALFAATGVLCALSPTIEMLLVARVLQGVGAAAAPVVARAMVRDTHPGSSAANLLSTMLAVLAIAPMVAPFLGGLLVDVASWRAIFIALALCGCILFTLAASTLTETHPPERRVAHGIVRNFVTFLKTPGTRLPMFVSCATFAGQFAYISDSPFVLIDGYGVAPDHYGFYFGANALALMAGSIGGGAMLRAGRSPRSMLRLGTSLLLVGGTFVVAGTRLDFGLVGFFAPMIVYFLGVGLTTPSATALAMEPVPQLAGTASAAIGSLQYVCGAASGYFTTKLGGSSPRFFAIVVAAMAVIAAGLGWSSSRSHVVRA